MYLKRYIVFLVAFTCSMTAHAYKGELSAQLSRVEFENNDRHIKTRLNFTHYMSSTEDAADFYDEYEFIHRIASLTFFAEHFDYDGRINRDRDYNLGGVEVAILNKSSNFTFRTGVTTYEQEVNLIDDVHYEKEFKHYWFEPGFYVKERMHLSLILDYHEVDALNVKAEELSLGLAAKALYKSFNLEGRVLKVEYDMAPNRKENNYLYAAAVDYYLQRDWRLGVVLSLNDGQVKHDNYHGQALHTQYYFTDTLSASIKLTQMSYRHNDDFDHKGVDIQFSYRISAD